jgi:hypothetical protein
MEEAISVEQRFHRCMFSALKRIPTPKRMRPHTEDVRCNAALHLLSKLALRK